MWLTSVSSPRTSKAQRRMAVSAGGSPERKLADEVARRDRLRKQLAECDKKIGALQAA